MRMICLMAALVSAGAYAQDHEHHHEGGSALSKLTLDGSKKWQTDEQLRKGMATIRDDVQAAIEPIHAGKFQAKDYEALAARLEKQIGTVISKCKLAPAADAQLHLVLADLVAGADAMKKDGDRKRGVVLAIEALLAYPKFFEHPGWKPIKH
ncbi:MAG: hypothetical protein IT380_25235 [Myxococcales bacterium]|nr:hypothetical protein [Myxococcales bacterium]